MRNALALIAAAALAATAVALTGPAQAHDRWPDIPYEIDVGCRSLASLGFPIAATTAPPITFTTARIMADAPRLFFSTTPIGPSIDSPPIASFRERISVPKGGAARFVRAGERSSPVSSVTWI